MDSSHRPSTLTPGPQGVTFAEVCKASSFTYLLKILLQPVHSQMPSTARARVKPRQAAENSARVSHVDSGATLTAYWGAYWQGASGRSQSQE